MIAQSWCEVKGCNERAAFVIYARTGKYRPLLAEEIALPPDLAGVCVSHLETFIKWQLPNVWGRRADSASSA